MKLTKAQQEINQHLRIEYARFDFDSSYPDIASFSLELEEKNSSQAGTKITRSKAHFQPIFCNDSYCQEGGFDLLETLEQMVRARETQRVIDKECPGHYFYKGQPYKTCSRGYKGTLTVAYKEPQGVETEPPQEGT